MCVWDKRLLVEIKQLPEDVRVPVWLDNHGAIATGNDEVGLTPRNKWMDLDYFHFRGFQREGSCLNSIRRHEHQPSRLLHEEVGRTEDQVLHRHSLRLRLNTARSTRSSTSCSKETHNSTVSASRACTSARSSSASRHVMSRGGVLERTPPVP